MLDVNVMRPLWIVLALTSPAFAQQPLAVVHFGTDSARLGPEERGGLESAVTWLNEDPDRVLVVEGHADRRGPAAANLTLSQRRSEAVQRELVALGADPMRLVGAAYGEAEAVADLRASRAAVVTGERLFFGEQPPPARDVVR
ncbi:MAG: OmpA family protein [Deltaproteobacteria bacterium]|nr:OmpA family protein [Deltaproteobacteria bacterium]